MEATGATINFTRMADGTEEDYKLLDVLERDFSSATVDRVLKHLLCLEQSFSGYKVSRLGHSLQTATRAWRDGADEETIVVALLHDIGDTLSPENHGELAARNFKTFCVSQELLDFEVSWRFSGILLFPPFRRRPACPRSI